MVPGELSARRVRHRDGEWVCLECEESGDDATLDGRSRDERGRRD
jgi:hypothetical protein